MPACLPPRPEVAPALRVVDASPMVAIYLGLLENVVVLGGHKHLQPCVELGLVHFKYHAGTWENAKSLWQVMSCTPARPRRLCSGPLKRLALPFLRAASLVCSPPCCHPPAPPPTPSSPTNTHMLDEALHRQLVPPHLKVSARADDQVHKVLDVPAGGQGERAQLKGAV